MGIGLRHNTTTTAGTLDISFKALHNMGNRTGAFGMMSVTTLTSRLLRSTIAFFSRSCAMSDPKLLFKTPKYSLVKCRTTLPEFPTTNVAATTHVFDAFAWWTIWDRALDFSTWTARQTLGFGHGDHTDYEYHHQEHTAHRS